jgi:nucleotide-binding universal stress UspA family protein
MIQPVKSILFATNLSKSCIPAFNFAASIATRYQATLVILHVIEKIPDYAESRIKGLLGEKQWEEIEMSHEKNARQALIGKRSTNQMIRSALEQFCTDAGIDDSSCGYHSREIVLSSGNLVEEIVKTAAEYSCNLVVMGTHQGVLRDDPIGSTLKSVLKRAKLPLLIVPAEPAEGLSV